MSCYCLLISRWKQRTLNRPHLLIPAPILQALILVSPIVHIILILILVHVFVLGLAAVILKIPILVIYRVPVPIPNSAILILILLLTLLNVLLGDALLGAKRLSAHILTAGVRTKRLIEHCSGNSCVF